MLAELSFTLITFDIISNDVVTKSVYCKNLLLLTATWQRKGKVSITGGPSRVFLWWTSPRPDSGAGNLITVKVGLIRRIAYPAGRYSIHVDAKAETPPQLRDPTSRPGTRAQVRAQFDEKIADRRRSSLRFATATMLQAYRIKI